jgi:hypothetical protein
MLGSLGTQCGLSLLHVAILFARIEGSIIGPLKRLVDGTVDLAYRRGCLDGFICGFMVVAILMWRRRTCDR